MARFGAKTTKIYWRILLIEKYVIEIWQKNIKNKNKRRNILSGDENFFKFNWLLAEIFLSIFKFKKEQKIKKIWYPQKKNKSF